MSFLEEFEQFLVRDGLREELLHSCPQGRFLVVCLRVCCAATDERHLYSFHLQILRYLNGQRRTIKPWHAVVDKQQLVNTRCSFHPLLNHCKSLKATHSLVTIHAILFQHCLHDYYIHSVVVHYEHFRRAKLTLRALRRRFCNLLFLLRLGRVSAYMLHLLCDIIDLKDLILKTIVTVVLAIFLEFAKIIFGDAHIPKSARLRCNLHIFVYKLTPERNLLIDVGQKRFFILLLNLFGCGEVEIHLLVDMCNFTLDLLLLFVSNFNCFLLVYTTSVPTFHLFLFAAVIIE